MTPAQFRKAALALPNAEEQAHMDHPDFRVNGKIFAGLSRDEKEATLKLTPEIQATLLDDAFKPAAGAWGKKGWTKVHLEDADAALVKSLVKEAFTLVSEATAPKARRSRATRSSR